jgi:hypothetical protein
MRYQTSLLEEIFAETFSPYEIFGEFPGEGWGYETWEREGAPAEVEKLNCATVATDCLGMKPAEEKRIVKSKTQAGAFLDRTEGDRNVNFALQLTDYDVNDWIIRKANHREAINRITEFIVKRAQQSNQGIEVTITGSASRTGRKGSNDILSCKRANCAAYLIRLGLGSYGLLGRTKIDSSGEGFAKAVCKGNECELPEYRSVLVQVHAPGQKPPKIEPKPGWDKFQVRCCSYKTEKLIEALLGDVLDKGLDQTLSQLPPAIRNKLKAKLIEWLQQAVKAIIKRRSGLSRLSQAIGKLLRYFPVRLIRDRAVFQIVEREKPNSKEITFCYTGYGFTIINPREALDRLLDMIPVPIPVGLKEELKKALQEIPGIGTIFRPIESVTSGPFKPFDIDRKEVLSVFAGSATIGKDALTIGKIHLIFSSPPFRHADPWKRPKIINCPDCAANVIPLQVGDGGGSEIFAVTEGNLQSGDCRCVEVPVRGRLPVRPPTRPPVRAYVGMARPLQVPRLRI